MCGAIPLLLRYAFMVCGVQLKSSVFLNRPLLPCGVEVFLLVNL
jgi:hypothetical protein